VKRQRHSMQSPPQSSLDLSISSSTGLSPIPIPPQSNISSSSLDSGIFSSVSSLDTHTPHNLFRERSHTEENEDIFLCSLPLGADNSLTLSPSRSGETKSCTVTPQHSRSEIQPQCPETLPSATRYQAVFPRPLPQRKQATLHGRSRSWSKRGPNLPTLPESRSLGHEFDTLNKEVEETMRKIRSHSLSSQSGEQTPPPLERRRSGATKTTKKRKTHKRTHSDGDSLSSLAGFLSPPQTPPLEETRSDGAKTKKEAKTHKRTHSEGDASITINVHIQRVYYVPSRTDGENAENTETQVNHGSITSSNEEDSLDFVQEDLTRQELLQIANEINPDRGHSLNSILHQSTHVWTEISHLHPPLSPRDKIFSVLERWFENVSESPENRRTLANACRRVEQLRVASRIARKSYVTS
jgi:hypothetical protein